jgi:hypothetical protein
MIVWLRFALGAPLDAPAVMIADLGDGFSMIVGPNAAAIS